LIIIDDEHDPSYKESTMVRYNVQDVAIKTGRNLNIPVVFASNTPSIRLWYRAKKDDDFRILKPDVSFFKDNVVSKEAVDLKAVDTFKEDISITNILYRTIKTEMEAGNKALVFYNKRGYSSFLVCRDCGNIPVCPRCHISYSYHNSNSKLVCHHCNHSEDFTGQCRVCGSRNLQFRGTGIEKIESKLKKRFKDITVMRIDSDFIKNKQEGRKVRKKLVADGPLILLGTQKILKNTVKGLTAASIINYDSLFQIPDFQINERVFQLLVQVLSKIINADGSRFIIQTFNSENEVLGSFISGDYEDFYKKEIKRRKDLYYPPYSGLINIIMSGKDDRSVRKDIKLLADKISGLSKPAFLMLGPAPAPFHKRNLMYRWHIMVKTGSVIMFNNNLRKILDDFSKNDENKIVFDIDPVWIL
jgi:primosomal protein N' (replication factor Y)